MVFDQPLVQVMTDNPVTLDVNQQLSDARSIFSQGHIHHLPVVEDGKLVGIISSNDIIKLAMLHDDNGPLSDFLDRRFTLAEVMQKDPVFVGVDATIREAAQILAASNFNGLPVVGYNNLLKGIVTSTDMIQLLLKKLPQPAHV